jgi:hypothetical protein
MGRVHSSCLNTRIATGVWLRTTGLIGGLWPCIELKALLSMAWKSQPKRLRSKRKKAHIYAIGNGSMRSTRPNRKYPDRVSCVELTVRANFMMPVATPRCNSTLSAPKIQHALRTGAERLGKGRVPDLLPRRMQCAPSSEQHGRAVTDLCGFAQHQSF